MKWRCTLIQRRLPDYPDGEMTPFWNRLVAAHVKVCPECRQELEELSEVVRHYMAHPLPDPGPGFWQEFERELHLKLAQVNQGPEPAPRHRRLPHYLVGATALAGILALAVYLGPFTSPNSASKMAPREKEAMVSATPLAPSAPQAPRVTPAVPAPPSSGEVRPSEMASPEKAKALLSRFAEPKPAPAGESKFSLAPGKLDEASRTAFGEAGLWPDDDFLSWDLDAVVADLSREERENLKRRLESRR